MALSAPAKRMLKILKSEILSGNAALFAGAGTSIGAGYVDWKELLREIAVGIELDIDREPDLLQVAQYHKNKFSREDITRKVVQEFTDDAKPTPFHEVLPSIGFDTIWTTNYDKLIETSLSDAGLRVDTKRKDIDVQRVLSKRDATVYKMHGDIDSPEDVVLLKEDYQAYYISHPRTLELLRSHLTIKTFLFVGFSFNDPNLDYILGRLRLRNNGTPKNHFWITRKHLLSDFEKNLSAEDVKAEFEYAKRKLELQVLELKRYGVDTIYVDDYDDIPKLLEDLSNSIRRENVFISGSADSYEPHSDEYAKEFIHSLSAGIISKKLKVVNGFGLGIGNFVINGALSAIYENPNAQSMDQLIMRPFPQKPSAGISITETWESYRRSIIARAGIAVFIYGNKSKDGQIINADGVKREFEIAREYDLACIPIALTGSQAKLILEENSTAKSLGLPQAIHNNLLKLNNSKNNFSPQQLAGEVVKLIANINA